MSLTTKPMPELTGDDARRFLGKVEQGERCWLFVGAKSDGYGRFSVGGRKGGEYGAHRVAYELWIGPIPDGLTIDHLCHDPNECRLDKACPHRACVNPFHLEAVPFAVNVARGEVGRRAGLDRCKRGHAFDEANTLIRPDGTRKCRACHRLHQSRYLEKATMPLTLKDLRVHIESPAFPGDRHLGTLRDASLVDLVEVLKQEGAVEWRCVASGAGTCGDGIKMVNPFWHRRCGRYLVLPLDGTTPK